MVKLTEVPDEHFEEVQPGPSDNDDDFEDYSDSDSDSDPLHPHHRHPHHGSHHPHHPRHPGKRFQEAYSEEESESDEEDEDEDDDITLEETLYERLIALKDIIPIKQRMAMTDAVKGVWDWASWGGKAGGRVVFMLSTGVLMVGVPYALAVAEEGQMIEMEREMKLQQSANELIAGGAGGPLGGQQGQQSHF